MPLPAPATATPPGLALTGPKFEPLIPPPTGEKLRPPFVETTVVPLRPTATAWVGESKATAKTGCVDGEIAAPVAPPSVVRTIWAPEASAIRQVCGSEQSSEVRLRPAGAPASGTAFQVWPPSTVFSTVVPGPTA